jgi:hypothetical protein
MEVKLNRKFGIERADKGVKELSYPSLKQQPYERGMRCEQPPRLSI